MSRLWLVLVLGLSMVLGGCGKDEEKAESSSKDMVNTAPVTQQGGIEVQTDSYNVPWMKNGQSAWLQIGDYMLSDDGDPYETCEDIKRLKVMSADERLVRYKKLAAKSYFSRSEAERSESYVLSEGRSGLFGPILGIAGGYLLTPMERPEVLCETADKGDREKCRKKQEMVHWRSTWNGFVICRPDKG